METRNIPISEGGVPLTNSRDGVIVQGNIYVARLDEDGCPDGGLIGNNFPNTEENPAFYLYQIRTQAYTWKELFEALDVSPDEIARQYHRLKAEGWKI